MDLCFFFFQAEDGIRDVAVTGVQTCALPIFIAENVRLDLGVSAHARFYDQVEKRGGVWKIAKRQGIYDFAYFNFPQGVVEVHRALVKQYPREYAALAYCLEKSGFPVKRVFATKGSDLEKTIKANGQSWLAA